MPSLREALGALYGSWRLMRFDAGGVGWFEVSIPAFWRSFWVALPLAPAYAVMVALDLARRPDPIDPGWALLVFTLAYIAGWAAFPIAVAPITKLLRLTRGYVPLIIVANWSAIPQMAVLLPVMLLDASGILPEAVAGGLMLVANVYLLAYFWFIARVTLDTSGWTAVGIVVLNEVLGAFVHISASSLL